MGDRAPSEAFGLLPTIYDDRAELGSLAGECEDWAVDAPHSGHRTGERCGDMHLSLRRAAEHGGWVWPSRPVVFVSDPHADAEGFLRSLVAAGVIRRSVVNTHGFELTTFGRSARIVVGGDCLDKGPSNLDLLDVLNTLIKTGADVHLLAGNHDLRLHLAVVGLSGPRTALTEHLFVRMGRKIVPLLREVRDRYLAHADRKCWLSEKDARARIFPSDKWAKKFPKAAAASMPQATIEKEVAKLAKKSAAFDAEVAKAGLTMSEIHAAAQMCRELFLEPGGSYGWFYSRMDVICRMGSLLFVHAGIDDSMCALLSEKGPEAVNRRYRAEVKADPFSFYSGPVANLVRTKYRKTDKALTEAGVGLLLASGIKMVVQGHVNNHSGQRLLAKNGLLHLEADITLDRTSRMLEGLAGIGAGATLILPSGDVIGLSSDYPKAKHFNPALMLGRLTTAKD